MFLYIDFYRKIPSVIFYFLSVILVALIFISIWSMSVMGNIGDVPQSDLLGHWTFDENTGSIAYDMSGNGNDGTLINSPLWTNGVSGNAISFTYSSTTSGGYVTFPNTIQNTNFPQSGTFAFWIKGDFSSQQNKSILDTGRNVNHIVVRTTNTPQPGLQIVFQDANSYLNACSSYVYYQAGTTTDCTLFPVNAHEWTHIGVTWDSLNKIGHFYKNGVLDRSFFWGKKNQNWVPDMQLFRINNPTYNSEHSMDELLLYRRILSPEEIFSIYEGSNNSNVDTVPPDTPINITASPLSPSMVIVGWENPCNDVTVDGYTVYRDGVLVGRTSSCTYVDTLLATSTSYQYTVFAYDFAGNRSNAAHISVKTTESKIKTRSTFDQDIDNPSSNIIGWSQQAPNPESLTVSSELSRLGAKSVKFDFNYVNWADTQTATSGRRSEILQSNKVLFNLGDIMWTSFSEYIPNTWEYDYPENHDILWQWHGVSEGPASGGSPPLNLQMEGDTAHIIVRGEDANGVKFMSNIGSFPASEIKGKWTDWVVKTVFDYQNGLVKIWKDGKLIVNYVGSTVYHSVDQTTESGLYLKLGIYKSRWGKQPTKVSNRTLFVDEIFIADSGANCLDVYIGKPCTSNVFAIAVTSSNTSPSLATAGDTLTISFDSNDISKDVPLVSIFGRNAKVRANGDGTGTSTATHWTASILVTPEDPEGNVPFEILVKNDDGTASTEISSTTPTWGMSVHQTPTPTPTPTPNSSPLEESSGNKARMSNITNYFGSSPYILPSEDTLLPLQTYPRTLMFGDYGRDVAFLQKMLVTYGYTNIDNLGYFGYKTYSSLKEFQENNNTLTHQGVFDLATRAYVVNINHDLIVRKNNAQLPQYEIVRNLKLGDTGEDVSWLQGYLINHAYIIESFGIDRGVFDTVTHDALTRFQEKNKQNIWGSVSYSYEEGYLDEKTRDYINSNQ